MRTSNFHIECDNCNGEGRLDTPLDRSVPCSLCTGTGEFLFGTATFSDDDVYRYELTRELGGMRPLVTCGLNPSTADASKNDQTIRKDIGFAKHWGCGRVLKT